MPRLSTSLEAVWSRRLNDCILTMDFSSCGSYLAAAEASGRVVIYQISSGKPLSSMDAHGFGTTSVAFQPGSTLLATAGQDGKARLWNALEGQLLHTLDAGATWGERVAWSPSGRYLATAAGKALRLWNPDGSLHSAAPAHNSTIADLEWMPATARYPGDVLAWCGYGGLVFWRPDLGHTYKSFDYKGSMLKIRWSPNACFIGTGNQDASMQFFVLPEGIEGPSRDLVMWGYRTKILHMTWDPKSRFLATGGSSTIVLWDCSGKGPAGSKPGLLDFHMRLISGLAWQANGPLLASGCEEGLLALWNPARQDRPIATDHLGASISQILWSPQDHFVAAATEDGDLKLYPGAVS